MNLLKRLLKILAYLMIVVFTLCVILFAIITSPPVLKMKRMGIDVTNSAAYDITIEGLKINDTLVSHEKKFYKSGDSDLHSDPYYFYKARWIWPRELELIIRKPNNQILNLKCVSGVNFKTFYSWSIYLEYTSSGMITCRYPISLTLIRDGLIDDDHNHDGKNPID